MTARQSSAATQLELPLTDHSTGTRPRAARSGARAGRNSPATPARRAPGPSRPRLNVGDGSRLDEQTRAIGRQGIAAARALLAATGAPGVGEDHAQGAGERGTAGCAA